MERMQSMFSNAFTTKAGQLVEKATSSTLTAEDWSLNMEICDCVNSYEDGAKDAVKAIKKRLSNNKNFNQISFTLMVLETCVKNCGSRFHVHVTTKEFSSDVLLKLINPKNNPPLALQQKVLSIIQQWAETFKTSASMNGVVQVYEELVEKGWEFPKPDKSSAAPIITPKRSVPEPVMHNQPQNVSGNPYYGGLPASQPPRIPPGAQPSTGPITPSQEQISKLRSELQVVLGNVQVMSDMLTELVPGQTEPSDLELLQELNRTCRAMQQRIVELVERVTNEELTIELLTVNDDLNNVFLRYERFERYRVSQTTATSVPAASTTSTMPEVPSAQPAHSEPPPSYYDTEQPTPEVNDLIDLGSDPVQSMTSTNTSVAASDFASISLDQMMMTPAQPASYPELSQDLAQFGKLSVSSDNQATEEISQAESEITQWLEGGGGELTGNHQISMSNPKENVFDDNANTTTDEFNAFLTERARAGESLPDVPTDQIGQNNGSERGQRKMASSNQPMFGL